MPQTNWKSSNFLFFFNLVNYNWTSPLIRPPCYYDHFFVPQTNWKSNNFLFFFSTLLIIIGPPRWYDYLVITTTFYCPKRIESPVISFFFFNLVNYNWTTPLLRPPRYYDHFLLPQTNWKSSNFLFFFSTLLIIIGPPRCYDHLVITTTLFAPNKLKVLLPR